MTFHKKKFGQKLDFLPMLAIGPQFLDLPARSLGTLEISLSEHVSRQLCSLLHVLFTVTELSKSLNVF